MKIANLMMLTAAILFMVSCEEDDPLKNSHRIKTKIIDNVDSNDLKSAFTYNESKLVMITHSEMNEFGSWSEYRRREMEYNSSTTIKTTYNNVSGNWQMTDKSEYKVENGLITEEINYDYGDFGWEVDWKWNYQYSGTDLIAWQSYYEDDMGNMVQDGKGEYLFSNGILTEYLGYYLDDQGNWVPSDRETFTYTGDNLTTWVDYDYNESGQPVRYYKCEQQYSGNQITGAYYYAVDSITNQWKSTPYYTETYSYNSDGYLTQLLEDDGTRETYEYEEGHGNAKYFWYFPENLVYGQATLKSGSKEEEYIPYYRRIRR